MFVTLFGRPGCSFCIRARQLAERLEAGGAISGYRYVDILAEGLTKADLEKTVGKPVKTVPQIFLDQTHVGGFTDFARYVRDNAMLPENAQP